MQDKGLVSKIEKAINYKYTSIKELAIPLLKAYKYMY